MVKIKVIDETPEETPETLDELDSAQFKKGGVTNLVTQAGRLYFNVLTLPVNLLPRRSRYHAKNSLREGLLSLKSLVEEVGEGIDRSLKRSIDRDEAEIADGDTFDDLKS